MARYPKDREIYSGGISVNIINKNDLPLGLKHRKTHKHLEELSIDEVRIGVENHKFTHEELEYLVDALAMKISVYLSNKFYMY
jgi:hypothetical protein